MLMEVLLKFRSKNKNDFQHLSVVVDSQMIVEKVVFIS